MLMLQFRHEIEERFIFKRTVVDGADSIRV